jgi:hypothetical protein
MGQSVNLILKKCPFRWNCPVRCLVLNSLAAWKQLWQTRLVFRDRYETASSGLSNIPHFIEWQTKSALHKGNKDGTAWCMHLGKFFYSL